jgi:hypothetical protein
MPVKAEGRAADSRTRNVDSTFLEDRRVANLHLSRVCSARCVSSVLCVRANADGLSKRQRIELALANLTQEELARFALKLAAYRGDIARLMKRATRFLRPAPPLTRITRRDVARVFVDDLAGERGTVKMVGRYFPLSTPLEDFLGSRGRSPRDEIALHMDHFPGDWSVAPHPLMQRDRPKVMPPDYDQVIVMDSPTVGPS